MRSGATDETDCDGIRPNPPGPSRSSMRPAQGVGRLARSPGYDLRRPPAGSGRMEEQNWFHLV